jgi:DNA-binding response OmpR family regulator
MSHEIPQVFRDVQVQVKTILIVEDDKSIGNFLIEALTQETAHHAMLAADGLQALQIIREIKPALFVLDYHLPSMNGLELYDQLHHIQGLEHVPALMLSARLPKDEMSKRQLMGMDKPMNLNDFLDTVDALLA